MDCKSFTCACTGRWGAHRRAATFGAAGGKPRGAERGTMDGRTWTSMGAWCSRITSWMVWTRKARCHLCWRASSSSETRAVALRAHGHTIATPIRTVWAQCEQKMPRDPPLPCRGCGNEEELGCYGCCDEWDCRIGCSACIKQCAECGYDFCPMHAGDGHLCDGAELSPLRAPGPSGCL